MKAAHGDCGFIADREYLKSFRREIPSLITYKLAVVGTFAFFLHKEVLFSNCIAIK